MIKNKMIKAIKNIVALVLIAAMLGAAVPTYAAATDNSDLTEAREFIGYLLPDFKADGTVTRAQFTAALTGVLRLDGGSGAAAVFEDVPSAHAYAMQIYTALGSGFVSAADKFCPDSPVTAAQALKMIVTALDYDVYAKYSGGYPLGYTKAAKMLDITDGIAAGDAELNYDDVCDMLYRMLICTRRITGIENGSFRFENTDVTNLELLYGLKICRGIVTETNFNSYRTAHNAGDEGYIAVDGVQYFYDGAAADLLGHSVCVYYRSGTHEAVLAVALDDDEEKFDIDDVTQLDGTTLAVVNDKNKTTRYDISGATLIFNGRACPTFSLDSYEGDCGYVRITDNDRDGKYEYVFVDSYRYMYINRVDTENEIITDESGTRMYKTADDGITQVTDVGGAVLGFDDISVGAVAAVACSADCKLGRIVICSGTADVTITAKSDDEIDADGTLYDVSDYALKNYSKELEIGRNVTLFLGLNGEVAAAASSSADMKYGYLIDAEIKGGLDEKVRIKLYDPNVGIKIFGAQRVKFNDESTARKDADILTPISSGADITPQLIRYKTDTDGDNIVVIDTAETNFDFDSKPTSDNDSLRRHSFVSGGADVTSFLYKSGGKSCAPYFNLNGTVILSVPNDSAVKNADESDFSSGTADVLTNNKNYAFLVYDMDESGSAGAVVVKGTYIDGTADYMAEKVLRGIMPDGNDGTVVRCIRNRKYSDVYIPDSVRVKVSAGDIINVHNNPLGIADRVNVIFYGSGAYPIPNPSSGARFEDTSKEGFWYGVLYSKGSDYGYVSNTTDANGNYDFGFDNLKNIRINTNNISLINKNKTVARPITLSELKDYKYFGGESHYVVVKLSESQSASAIYVYER